MCGVVGIVGDGATPECIQAMNRKQRHRGPDDSDVLADASAGAALGHTRLSILDLSEAGRQPMRSTAGRVTLAFNGEIYNYLELRRELSEYSYRTRTDSEVILAAYQRWGLECFERFVGMFALLLWDQDAQIVVAARDRFGVKPLYYYEDTKGNLLIASEIKALHAAGAPREPDAEAWAAYLALGVQDREAGTFWKGVRSVPAGGLLLYSKGKTTIRRWYDLAARIGDDYDDRPARVVEEEYGALLEESVRLRFRADVPVGINISGGLDSSILLGLVHQIQGEDSDVAAYTFVTGHADYDELPWVRQMLAQTRHPLRVCQLTANETPSLAQHVQGFVDEPFGGLPTLAYAKLFERAREDGTTVLLDGQGMDEQWAGYDYYRSKPADAVTTLVQGSRTSPVRPECLADDFSGMAAASNVPEPFSDRLRNLQFRDITASKLPRALRYNDRVSMRSSTELREPFLDHRLVELAMRQPPERKTSPSGGKVMLRGIAERRLPRRVVEAPKRPLQTPQREWLRGELREWTESSICSVLRRDVGAWFEPAAVERAWGEFLTGECDNSFFIWQWISLDMLSAGDWGRRSSE